MKEPLATSEKCKKCFNVGSFYEIPVFSQTVNNSCEVEQKPCKGSNAAVQNRDKVVLGTRKIVVKLILM